jgi:plastocyanin
MILAIISIAVLLGCTTSGKNLPVTEAKATSTDHVQEATLRVESFFFEPSRLEVAVNVPVRLTLKSGAFIIGHNFSIHAPEAGIEISADVGHGKTVVVEFRPTKTGEYQFYCDKGSHADKGMTGTIVVVEK